MHITIKQIILLKITQYLVALLVIIFLMPQNVFASAPVKQIDRYSVIETAPSLIQYDVLSNIVTVPFSDQIKTVGQAVIYLLKRSGYELASLEASDPSLHILLDKKTSRNS